MHVIIITEDDLSNIYTVEEAVHKIGFGVFQILLSFFCGAIWVKQCVLELCAVTSVLYVRSSYVYLSMNLHVTAGRGI